MSRGVHNFKQADVTKALKAAVKAGLKGWRVEIVAGKIVIRAGEGNDPANERDQEWD